MRVICLTGSVLVIAALVQLGGPPVQSSERHPKEIALADTPLETLKSSRDGKELVRAALVLAGSREAADHDVLLRTLQSADFLDRLDDEDAYRGRPKRLRLWRILETLSKNPAPSSDALLVALTQSPVFTQDEARVDLLIYVSATLRPISIWMRNRLSRRSQRHPKRGMMGRHLI